MLGDLTPASDVFEVKMNVELLLGPLESQECNLAEFLQWTLR